MKTIFMKVIIIIIIENVHRIIEKLTQAATWPSNASVMCCVARSFLLAKLPLAALLAASRRTRPSARPVTRVVLKLVRTSVLSDHHCAPRLELAFPIAQCPPFRTYVSLSALLPSGSFALGLTFSVVFAELVRMNLLANNRSSDLCVFL